MRASCAALCRRFFARVELLGLHGSSRYQALVAEERRELDRLLALDPMRLRRLIPRRARQRLYDRRLRGARASPRPGALDIGPEDFRLSDDRARGGARPRGGLRPQLTRAYVSTSVGAAPG